MLTSCQDEKGGLGSGYVHTPCVRDFVNNQASLNDTVVNACERVVGQSCRRKRTLHYTQSRIASRAIHGKTPHPSGGSHPAGSPALPIARSEPRARDHCCKTERIRNIVGGVIAPLLANIFLHYVLDVWFEQEVKPRLKGHAYLIRYADDFVIGFANERDARRVLEVLPKRMAKYGLTLHPDKTRLVPFQRPSAQPPRGSSGGPGPQPGTFDLLGFCHYWGRSWRGYWVVKRKTMPSRFGRALRKIAQWCRASRHQPIPEQHRILSLKVLGHYGYFGITGNFEALHRFRDAVRRVWRRWLSRRSGDYGAMAWTHFAAVWQCYPLPPARVVHSEYRL